VGIEIMMKERRQEEEGTNDNGRREGQLKRQKIGELSETRP
jgi:hypothetical protein